MHYLLKTNDLSICNLYHFITIVCISQDEIEKAEKYNNLMYKNLYEIKGNLHDYWLKEYYLSKGKISLEKKEYEIAKAIFIKVYDGVDNVGKEIQKNYYFGKIAYEQESYHQSIEYLENYLAHNKNIETTILYDEKLYLYLAESYKKIGQINKAYEYFEKHIKQFYKHEKYKDNITLKIREKEIEEARLEFKNLKTQKEERESYFFYSIISLSVLILSGLLYIIKNKRINM